MGRRLGQCGNPLFERGGISDGIEKKILELSEQVEGGGGSREGGGGDRGQRGDAKPKWGRHAGRGNSGTPTLRCCRSPLFLDRDVEGPLPSPVKGLTLNLIFYPVNIYN